MAEAKLEDIPAERLLRPAEVCKLLNCSRQHLRKWADELEVPYIQEGQGLKRYLIADVRVMLDKLRSRSNAAPRVPVFDATAARAAAAATANPKKRKVAA